MPRAAQCSIAVMGFCLEGWGPSVSVGARADRLKCHGPVASRAIKQTSGACVTHSRLRTTEVSCNSVLKGVVHARLACWLQQHMRTACLTCHPCTDTYAWQCTESTTREALEHVIRHVSYFCTCSNSPATAAAAAGAGADCCLRIQSMPAP
jgi:hypothetical protein